jgi:large subunit ribosomal protein L25
MAMQLLKISATRRNESGKEVAKRLRRDARIPAVVFGKGTPARALAVSPKDLLGVLQSELGRNSLVELDSDDGSTETVLLTDFQYHPVTRELLHADFLRVSEDQMVKVDVPFVPVGKPKGVIVGGILRVVYHKLPVRCLANRIPAKIEHDVSELDLDDSVAVSDLAVPEGVTIRLPATRTVAALVTEKKVEEAAPEKPAAAAAAAPGTAAPAEPAAAAPTPTT